MGLDPHNDGEIYKCSFFLKANYNWLHYKTKTFPKNPSLKDLGTELKFIRMILMLHADMT